MEVWKPVKGYEERYQVSNLGNVKSLNYHRENRESLLTQCKDSYGYLVVLLYKNGKRKTCAVHRLVAEAFLRNECDLPSINHKDENKENNHADNLEYCSVAYNNLYSKKVPVAQYDRSGNFIKRWDSIKEASEGTHTQASNIGACCRGYGRTKTAGGYVWKYAV